MQVYLNNKTTINLKTVPVLAFYQARLEGTEEAPLPPSRSGFYLQIGPNETVLREDDAGKKQKVVPSALHITAEEHTKLRDTLKKHESAGGNYYWLFGNVAINLDVVTAVRLSGTQLKVHYPGGVWTSPESAKIQTVYDAFVRHIARFEGRGDILQELSGVKPPPKPPRQTEEEKQREADDEAKFQEALKKYAVDMTEKARTGHLRSFAGRKGKIAAMADILLQPEKNNIALIGDPGSGKTALVEGLAYGIVNKTVPKELHNAEIYAVSLNAMDNTRWKGEFAGEFYPFVRRVVELNRRGRNIILFLDEGASQFTAGKNATEPAVAELMKPYLEDIHFKAITAMTLEESNKSFTDPALRRRFDMLPVSPPDYSETLEILDSRRRDYEDCYKIKIPPVMMKLIYDVTEDMLPNETQPDKSVKVFVKAAARTKNRGSKEMGREHILGVVEEMFDLPPGFLLDGERKKYQTLDAHLAHRVFGQDDAMREVTSNLKRGRARLSAPNRPIGTLLFMGPESSGRTTAAYAVAEHLAGGRKNLVRFDMRSFPSLQAARRRLLGTVGSNPDDHEQGALTIAIQRKPYSVLLFDHIDKAEPEVRDFIQEIVVAGAVADPMGKVFSLRNTIAIMTSRDNEGIGDLGQAANIVTFKHLSKDASVNLLRREATKLGSYLEEEWGMDINIPDKVVEELGNQGFREKWGAKRLASEFEKAVATPLGEWLIDNEGLKERFSAAANENRAVLNVRGIGGAFRVEREGGEPDAPRPAPGGRATVHILRFGRKPGAK